jgi:hypothetical protein
MTNKTNGQPGTTLHCWSCDGEIAPTDNFCRQCGMRLQPGIAPSMSIHDRLVSIEKMSLKTALGVAALLVLVGWILLQIYHFGRGGFFG